MSHLTRRLASIEHLPSTQHQLVSTIIQRPTFKAVFSAADVAALLDNNATIEQLLRDLVPLAQTYSVAPISDFKVGAVALADTGAIYLGANMEFSQQALNQSVHAEQAAISNAWHHHETRLFKIAVSATPCGHCRQFMNELAQANELEILLPQQAALSLTTLLPHSFGPTDLGVSDHLMDSSVNELTIESDDPLTQQANSAAQLSYSPYSNSPSGIALATHRGTYLGRYAENCAYNPSLSPLQSALIALHLADDQTSAITAAVLVETASAPTSQLLTSKNLLAQLCEIKLNHYLS